MIINTNINLVVGTKWDHLKGKLNESIFYCRAECGVNGRISDGGVIRNTTTYRKLENGTLNIPLPEVVRDQTTMLPYVFIGDEAFSLRPDFMKPFSQQALNAERIIYNFRLSHARRLIECVFGIVVKRFRILQVAIDLNPEKVNLIVLTICILHNFLSKKSTSYFSDEEEKDEQEVCLTSLQMNASNHNSTN